MSSLKWTVVDGIQFQKAVLCVFVSTSASRLATKTAKRGSQAQVSEGQAVKAQIPRPDTPVITSYYGTLETGLKTVGVGV